MAIARQRVRKGRGMRAAGAHLLAVQIRPLERRERARHLALRLLEPRVRLVQPLLQRLVFERERAGALLGGGLRFLSASTRRVSLAHHEPAPFVVLAQRLDALIEPLEPHL